MTNFLLACKVGVHDGKMKSGAGSKVLWMLALVFVALMLPLVLVVSGGWKMWQEHRAVAPLPAETSAALRDSVERAANAVLPTPTLGEGMLTIDCSPDQLEKETARIIHLVEGVGGVASLWKEEARVKVLANVPASMEDAFREAVRHNMSHLTVAADSQPTVVVEVLLRTSLPSQNTNGDAVEKELGNQ